MGAEVIEKDQTRARERSGSWIAAFLLLHGFFISLNSPWWKSGYVRRKDGVIHRAAG